MKQGNSHSGLTGEISLRSGGVLTIYGWLLSTFLVQVMDAAARSLPDQQFISLSELEGSNP